MSKRVAVTLLSIFCLLLPLSFQRDFESALWFAASSDRQILKGLGQNKDAIKAFLRSSSTPEAAYWNAVVHQKVVLSVVQNYVAWLQRQKRYQASYWITLRWINDNTKQPKQLTTRELSSLAAIFKDSPTVLHDWLTHYPDAFDGRLWKAYFREIATLTDLTSTSWLPVHYQQELQHEVAFLAAPPTDLNSQQCLISVLPVVETWQGLDRLREFYSMLKHDESVPIAGLCFQRAAIEPLSKLCDIQTDKHIQCDISGFDALRTGRFSSSQLLVVTHAGRSNTHLGVSYINGNSSAKVILHEFLHLFNFVDEYALPAKERKRFCRTTALQILGSNLVSLHKGISLKDIRRSLFAIREAGYRLGRWEMFLQPLIPVATCQGEAVAIYRIAASPQAPPTLMQYSDGIVPTLYWSKVAEEIAERRGAINHLSLAANDMVNGVNVDWQAIALANNGAANYFVADTLLASGKKAQALQFLRRASAQGYSLASLLLAVGLLKDDPTDSQHQALALIEKAVMSGEFLALEWYVSLLGRHGKHSQAQLWQKIAAFKP